MQYSRPTLKRLKTFLISCLFIISLSSCGSLIFAENLLVKNRENLTRLTIGMTKDDVMSVMGNHTVSTVEQLVINSPYRVETLKDAQNENLEIMFFYTDEKRDKQSVSDDELTPVVLKGGKVEGWGRTYLADIAPAYRFRYAH